MSDVEDTVSEPDISPVPSGRATPYSQRYTPVQLERGTPLSEIGTPRAVSSQGSVKKGRERSTPYSEGHGSYSEGQTPHSVRPSPESAADTAPVSVRFQNKGKAPAKADVKNDSLDEGEYSLVQSARDSVAASHFSHSEHPSRFSGRYSPAGYTVPYTVGKDPLTRPRFNEPLRLRKGRQLVEYEAPSPTVIYVPNKSSTHGPWTNVSVQRNSDGRWVVLDQQPVYTRFTSKYQKVSQEQYGQDLFGGGKTYRSKKSQWNWSTKGDYIERSINKGFYEPYLPPIRQKYNVDSKIGSYDNYRHQPGGGRHKIPHFKTNWKAEAKINSLPVTADNYSQDSFESTPRTASLKLPDISPRYGASADTGSFASIHYTPGGSVIVKKQKLHAKSKVGSLDNMSYSSYGGNVSLPKNSTSWRSGAKVGSLVNAQHRPRGGNVQIIDEKLNWQTSAKVGSLENADYHRPRRRRGRAPHFKTDFNQTAESKVGSLSNIHHQPHGGNAQIISERLNWNAKPKIKSRWGGMKYSYKELFEGSDTDENFSELASNAFTV